MLLSPCTQGPVATGSIILLHFCAPAHKYSMLSSPCIPATKELWAPNVLLLFNIPALPRPCTPPCNMHKMLRIQASTIYCNPRPPSLGWTVIRTNRLEAHTTIWCQPRPLSLGWKINTTNRLEAHTLVILGQGQPLDELRGWPSLGHCHSSCLLGIKGLPALVSESCHD